MWLKNSALVEVALDMGYANAPGDITDEENNFVAGTTWTSFTAKINSNY